MPREAFPDRSGVVAEVTWGEHGVQLATLSSDRETFVAWCREIVDQYDADKRAGANVLTGAPGRITSDAAESGPVIEHLNSKTRLLDGTSMGMFWTPSRWEIQQMIKTLRRARDRVYGADE